MNVERVTCRGPARAFVHRYINTFFSIFFQFEE